MPDPELVTVFTAHDPGQQAMAESVLGELGIYSLAKNEPVQDVIGVGRIGGYNLATGAVVIQVPSSDEERARRALTEILGSESIDLPEELQPEPELHAPSPGQAEQIARYSRYSIIWSVLWLAGIGSVVAIYFGARALRLARTEPSVAKTKARFGLAMGVAGLVIWVLLWGSALVSFS